MGVSFAKPSLPGLTRQSIFLKMDARLKAGHDEGMKFGGVLERRARIGKRARSSLQDTFAMDVVAQAGTHLDKRTHRCTGRGCAGAGASP
jgi:hypothetical protein